MTGGGVLTKLTVKSSGYKRDCANMDTSQTGTADDSNVAVKSLSSQTVRKHRDFSSDWINLEICEQSDSHSAYAVVQEALRNLQLSVTLVGQANSGQLADGIMSRTLAQTRGYFIACPFLFLLVPSDACKRLCLVALEFKDWSLMLLLVENGVAAYLRDTIIAEGVAKCRASGGTALLNHGIRAEKRAQLSMQLMRKRHNNLVVARKRDEWCDFADDLQKTCRTEKVTNKALLLKHWKILRALILVITTGLCKFRRERVCTKAVKCTQWELVRIFLMEDTCSGFQTVDIFFKSNTVQWLAEQFHDGTLPSVLASRLLLSSFCHREEIIAMKQQSSDLEGMEAIKPAVGFQDGDTFVQILAKNGHCCRSFKQHLQFCKQFQRVDFDERECRWMYCKLVTNGKKMALNVVDGLEWSMEGFECAALFIHRAHKFNSSIKKKKFWIAFKKICYGRESVYKETVKGFLDDDKKGKLFARCLVFFSVGVRWNLEPEMKFWQYCLSGVTRSFSVLGLGIRLDELEFALRWIFAFPPWLQRIKELRDYFMDINTRAALNAFALQLAMECYFEKATSECLADFLTLWEDHLSQFYMNERDVVRKVLTMAVEHGLTDMFTSLCHVFSPSTGTHEYELVLMDLPDVAYPMDEMNKERAEDLRFALRSAIKAEKEDLVEAFLKTMPTTLHTLNEIKIVLEVVLEANWKVSHKILPKMLHAMAALRSPADRVAILLKCLKEMANDMNLCNNLAHQVNQWIQFQKVDLGSLEKVACYICRGYISDDFCKGQINSNEEWVSRLATWCYHQHYFSLALFLAFIWRTNLDLNNGVVDISESDDLLLYDWNSYLHSIINHHRSCCASVSVLQVDYTSFCAVAMKHYLTMKQTVRSCQEKGEFTALDWALLLFSTSSTSDMLFELLRRETRFSQHILDFVLKSIMSGTDDLIFKCKVADELLSRFRFRADVLRNVLRAVVKIGQLALVEHMLDKVDPKCLDSENSSVLLNSLNVADKRTLLHMTGCMVDVKDLVLTLKFVRLCISAGISCHQRQLEVDTNSSYWSECLLCEFIACPPVVELLLHSGSVSHRALTKVCNVQNVISMMNQQHGLIQEDSRQRKESRNMIKEAVANVSRLTHLARLAVSDAVGCQPGRKMRIRSLPVPQVLKDFVHFKDDIADGEETRQ